MNDSPELSGILEVLTRIEGWLRFQNIRALKEMIEIELDDPRKKTAYENSDGIKSVREVAQMSNVPAGTLPGWWTRWFTIGIAIESPLRRGRMSRICSLRSLGIELPKSAERSSVSTAEGLDDLHHGISV